MKRIINYVCIMAFWVCVPGLTVFSSAGLGVICEVCVIAADESMDISIDGHIYKGLDGV